MDPLGAEILKRATLLAEKLMRRAEELETAAERRDRGRLAALVADREGIAFAARLLDRALRPRDPRRAASMIERAIESPPRLFTAEQTALLWAFRSFWRLAPSLAVGLFVGRLRREAAHLIVPGEPARLRRYLHRRQAAGVRVNLNLVAEAVLSRPEAERQVRRYEEALREPLVQAVSVKLSSISARVHPLAFDRVVEEAGEALRRLYRTAGPKLVTLDMEAYRDLEPTVEVFRAIAGEGEFLGASPGIALQAYLPDSFEIQRELAAFARTRREAGGAPLRVRIVKGANLAAERLEARLGGWGEAPFASKSEVDASMKRMVAHGLAPENAAALHVGVGSHNVFDIAYALALADENGTRDALTIEMLEGMAPPLARAVAEAAPAVRVYAPAAGRAEFLHAIAYLVRRLDENTSEENFLRHAFTMRAGDRRWGIERAKFAEACGRAGAPAAPSRRDQDRSSPPSPLDPREPFRNEPDTDFSRASNRRWIARAIASTSPGAEPLLAGEDEVEEAVDRAAADGAGWAARSHAERKAVSLAAARELRLCRGSLVAAMTAETRKTAGEGDPEVSEAIDYAEYYARSLDDLNALAAAGSVRVEPRGAIAVFPPWNFPLAIPLGGVFASLIGGNRVILKPSPFAVRVALAAAEAAWRAGVPREALQVVHCGREAAARLAAHPRLGALVFTGSTATAERILAARPGLDLFAETGGKNAVIVTATADRDLGIANILKGAFSHAGQKCSATSLVVAEAEVYDDPAFRRRLVEAARALRIGPAADLATDLPPLVAPPNASLAETYRRLPDGESWALAPERHGKNHFGPGVVWDVQEGSRTHREELFGPVLGVLRAADLGDAIRLVNATGCGLTSGLESLDGAEWRAWTERIEAGNLYVNRPAVGAVVERQPFGGWRRSGFGPGAKTGGPNYAAQLCRIEGQTDSRTAYDPTFARRATDPQRIPGQRNVFRYRPAGGVVIRVEKGDDPVAIRLRREAARAAGAEVEVSSFDTEPLDRLIARLAGVRRVVRCGAVADPALLAAAARAWTWVCREPLTGSDRDLLPFLLEQTLSIDTHRYGWVPPGADELPWLR